MTREVKKREERNNFDNRVIFFRPTLCRLFIYDKIFIIFYIIFFGGVKK